SISRAGHNPESDALFSVRQRSTLELADILHRFGQCTRELPYPIFQIAREFAGVGQNRKVKRARREAMDRLIGGAFRFEFTNGAEIEIEQSGAARFDEIRMKFAEPANHAPL